MLDNLHIILVETSHPGNIGGVARAMKNMGLSRLRLVKPKIFPDTQAQARSAGAEDVLATAEVFTNLAEAINDCSLVLGTSARSRSVEWPQLNVRDCAGQIMAHAQQQKVAVVFGRESSGLTNDELQHCHYQLIIPANPAYSSLNIAAAVQVISYELRVAAQVDLELKATPETLATAAQMEGFYNHLHDVAIDSDYLNPTLPGQLMGRLRRLFNRSHLTLVEINILRGLLTSIQHKIKPHAK